MLKDFSAEAFDIIIQGGQSNADGTGFGSAAEPYEQSPDIFYLTSDFIIVPAAETVWGNEIKGDFSLAFAAEYVKAGLLRKGRKLLILRSAVSGTGFSDQRWGPQDDLFLTMMEMIKTALELNRANNLKVFLWHQGETDVMNFMPAEAHRANLARLISLVRETYHCPELPFIAGGFVPQWYQWIGSFAIPIQTAIQALCQDDSRAAFVETVGLESNNQKIGQDDPIHFCRDSLNLLGKRYFKAFQKLYGIGSK